MSVNWFVGRARRSPRLCEARVAASGMQKEVAARDRAAPEPWHGYQQYKIMNAYFRRGPRWGAGAPRVHAAAQVQHGVATAAVGCSVRIGASASEAAAARSPPSSQCARSSRPPPVHVRTLFGLSRCSLSLPCDRLALAIEPICMHTWILSSSR